MMKNSVTDLLDRIKEEFSFHQAQNHRLVEIFGDVCTGVKTVKWLFFKISNKISWFLTVWRTCMHFGKVLQLFLDFLTVLAFSSFFGLAGAVVIVI